MKHTPLFSRRLIQALLVVFCLSVARAELPQPVPLPPPQTKGGRPLMEALKERKTTREFSSKPVSLQTLSDLLWAGFGINRPQDNRRTAPSGMNAQEIDLFVVTTNMVYRYDAKNNQLISVAEGDFRGKTGGQPFVKTAPVSIVFVANGASMSKVPAQDTDRYAWMDAGFISQNIYLFCASEGLGTVIHELDRTALKEVLHLKPDSFVVISQAIGYPATTQKP